MSDSELSDAPNALPDDATVESTLRRIVRDAIRDGQEITVRIARTRAEEELSLNEGFLKGDKWKDRSKEIINAAVEEPESPVKEKSKAGRKRKSEEPVEKPKKKAKQSPVVESDQEEEEEEPRAKAKPKPKPKPKASARKPPVVNSDDDEDNEPANKPAADDQDEDQEEASKPNGQTPAADEDDEANDSDMSSLIDEPPKKKKAPRQPKKSTSPNTTSKPTKSKDLSPDDEEIKRLQSQLLKCGIRKLWHRELAPFSTPKAKISHLKSMLTDVGMTGRFSAEKARAIKEARELEAELEAARDFEEKFGTGGRGRRAKREVNLREDGGSGEDDEGGEEKVEEGSKRPGGRLLPKGLVDFGDSGDDGSD